jgi:hypothetical protein
LGEEKIADPAKPRPLNDYRKLGNGTTTRALRFVSVLKFHQSSNRSH